MFGDAEMSEHAWTTEKPTQPGFYWWRQLDGDVTIVEMTVWKDGGRELMMFCSDEPVYIDKPSWMDDQRFAIEDSRGEWAGPLEHPK